eukprot:Skav229181  [mRNA]  locus=scaffold1004:241814:242636:- [translate_table: standard]
MNLKLADAFADTERGHLFRCSLLAEEKDLLQEEAQSTVERLVMDAKSSSVERPSGQLWPRQAEMAMGKRLFLKLLRTPFWMKWIAQGGESPSKVTTLSLREASAVDIDDTNSDLSKADKADRL